MLGWYVEVTTLYAMAYIEVVIPVDFTADGMSWCSMEAVIVAGGSQSGTETVTAQGDWPKYQPIHSPDW